MLIADAIVAQLAALDAVAITELGLYLVLFVFVTIVQTLFLHLACSMYNRHACDPVPQPTIGRSYAVILFANMLGISGTGFLSCTAGFMSQPIFLLLSSLIGYIAMAAAISATLETPFKRGLAVAVVYIVLGSVVMVITFAIVLLMR